MSGDLRALAEAALAIHSPRATSWYAETHHTSGHVSEDERCTDACFVDGTICNGCGTQKCSEPLVDVARRLLDERDALAAKVTRVEAVRQAFDPGELQCGRLGLPCTSVHDALSWCRACRIRMALGDQP